MLREHVERGLDGDAVRTELISQRVGVDGDWLSLGGSADSREHATRDVPGRIGAVDEKPLRAHVRVGEQQLAERREPVASGASDLLVVGFDRTGDVPMDHEADVGAVNAHAEGIGGDDNRVLGVHEGVVDARALGVGEASVVEKDRRFAESAAFVGKAGEHALGVFARGDVDDAGAVFADEIRDVPVLRVMVSRLVDGKVEVVAAESLDLHVGFLARGFAEAQLADDVGADIGGGGGRDGEDGDVGEAVERIPDVEVVGAEVVSPLADAVRLVDCEKGQFRAGDRLEEGRVPEPFGSDVHELVVAVRHRRETEAHFVGRDGRVEEGGGNLAFFEGGDLILHQGDERRDDERRAREEKGGELVAEGLAGAGRHDDDGVAAVDDLFDGLVLPVSEGAIAEVALQCRRDLLF